MNIQSYRYKAPVSSNELNDEERGAVAYFFARIKAIDPGQYDLIIPDLKTESVLKREYAPYIKDFTRDMIDEGLQALHTLRQQGHEDYRYLNIDSVIGLICGSTCKPSGIYKRFEPMLPEPEQDKIKRRAAGKSEIEKLKSMWE